MESKPVTEYHLESARTRRIRVYYPSERGQVVLRTELDWGADLSPLLSGESFTEFEIGTDRPYLYVTPCLRTQDDELIWAGGPHSLVLMTAIGTRDIYPFFFQTRGGAITEPIEFGSVLLQREHKLRVYLPPGYGENPMRTYPVLYMHDGKNLFFPEEAFLGREWGVDSTLALLDQMNAVDQIIVVAIYSLDRENDYTMPGYELYGRAVVEEVKPRIDAVFHTKPDAASTAVMGSSLGGVASFYMAWEWPDVFGTAACLSSTFSTQDNLIERVLREPKRNIQIYIDSGWPGDNYEVSLAMAMALIDRGYEFGRDLMHYAFPLADHSEPAWRERMHLPIQFFAGLPAVGSRRKRSLQAYSPLKLQE